MQLAMKFGIRCITLASAVLQVGEKQDKNNVKPVGSNGGVDIEPLYDFKSYSF